MLYLQYNVNLYCMFGLVRKSKYSELDSQVKILQNIIADKDYEITRLNSVISNLNEQLKKLESKNDVVLLTDVAETPLVEVSNTPKVVKKTVKKKATTPRKKVARKSEDVQ